MQMPVINRKCSPLRTVVPSLIRKFLPLNIFASILNCDSSPLSNIIPSLNRKLPKMSAMFAAISRKFPSLNTIVPSLNRKFADRHTKITLRSMNFHSFQINSSPRSSKLPFRRAIYLAGRAIILFEQVYLFCFCCNGGAILPAPRETCL